MTDRSDGGPISEARSATRRFGELSPTAVAGPALILVVAVVAWAGWFAEEPVHSFQKCDGQVMGPGDTCMVYGSGNSRSFTYEQAVANSRADWENGWWLAPTVCGILGTLAIAMILTIIVKLRRDRSIRSRIDDQQRPLILGASSPIGMPVVGLLFVMPTASVIGFVLLVGLVEEIREGWEWHWGYLIAIPFVAFVPFAFYFVWPKSGQLLRVYDDGRATIVHRGTVREVTWGDVWFHPQQNFADLYLVDGTKLLVVDRSLEGVEAVRVAFGHSPRPPKNR